MGDIPGTPGRYYPPTTVFRLPPIYSSHPNYVVRFVPDEDHAQRHAISLATLSANMAAGRFFRSNDHTQAEAMYTKAILLDPTAPTLYTNRAMARLQLGMLDDVLTDCKASLERNSEGNMKARYYAAQALLGLGRGEAALEEAKKAYEIAQVQELASLASVVALVLKCKKASWEEREKRRVKGQEGAKEMVIDALRRDLEKGLEEARDEVEKNDERLRIEELIKEVEDAWVAAGKAEKKRDVPDWAIDDITFSIMHDPVVVSSLPLLGRLFTYPNIAYITPSYIILPIWQSR